MSDQITQNRSLLTKADLALSDLIGTGGYMVTAQARAFVRQLIEDAVVLKRAAVVPMKAPKQLIERIAFGSRVLRPGVERVALPEADRVKPDTAKVELDAQLFKAEAHLSYETLEDSLEQQNLQQTVIDLLTEAAARDMDEAIVQGDTSSLDAFLASFDGLLVQANLHQVDAEDATLHKSVLRELLKALPARYMRNKAALEFLTSPKAAIDYADTLADRMTQIGDEKVLRGGMGVYAGVPVVDVPLFPEDIASTTPGSTEDTTNVILCDPKSINVGIWRQIRLETDKDISAGDMKIVATLRFDMKLTSADETAKAINVAFAGL